MSTLVSIDEAVDHGYLVDWLISSVGTEPPVWTEAHIEELLEDFVVIPKCQCEAKELKAGIVPAVVQSEKITRFADIPQFTRDGSYAVDYPLHSLIRWIESEEKEMGLQLNPDFQRGHVWTEAQQTAYIEFLLRGGKTGRNLYFNCPSWHRSVPEGAYNDYVCVDGLQRITAIRRFVHNEIKAFGSYFNEFEDSPRIMVDTMRVHVNDLKTKREVLQWYIDMNAGGTPHSDSEIARVRAMMTKEGEL